MNQLTLKDRIVTVVQAVVYVAIGAILMWAHLGKAESCDQLDLAKVSALENAITQHQRYEELLEAKVKQLEANTLRIQLANRPVIQEVRVEAEPIKVAAPVVVPKVEPMPTWSQRLFNELKHMSQMARAMGLAPRP